MYIWKYEASSTRLCQNFKIKYNSTTSCTTFSKIKMFQSLNMKKITKGHPLPPPIHLFTKECKKTKTNKNKEKQIKKEKKTGSSIKTGVLDHTQAFEFLSVRSSMFARIKTCNSTIAYAHVSTVSTLSRSMVCTVILACCCTNSGYFEVLCSM